MSHGYRRFLILSSPRCGTHMLRSALGEHPALVCLSEVFNPDFIMDAPFREDTPEQTILDEHVFCAYPGGIDAVGFALHRAGARFGRWPTLWQRLERDRDLRVISLSRLDLFGRYLSYRQMREKTDRSAARVVTPEELQAEFRIQETLVSAFDERFAHHPLLELKYEQLIDDWDAQMRRIQEFLGVETMPLRARTKKNERVPPRDLVENYDELVTHFTGTRWGWLFGAPGRRAAATAPSGDAQPPKA